MMMSKINIQPEALRSTPRFLIFPSSAQHSAHVKMGTTSCYFPSCISITLLSRKLSLTHHHQLLQPTTTSLTHFHVRASVTNKTRIRRSRRLKTDAEICNDIRQFLASVGLPEDHIPSTKELLHHGRNDLANIVRRRGHKQIQELLTSSLNANIESLNSENSLDERLDAADDCEDVSTGQNVKMDSLVDDVTVSSEVLLGNNSSSLNTDSTLSLDECTSIPLESSANSSVDDGLGELKVHAEEASNTAEGNVKVTIADNGFSSSREVLYPNFDDNQSSVPTEISGESLFVSKSSGNSKCEDNSLGKLVGEITLPPEVHSMENHSKTTLNDLELDTKDKVFSPLESSMDLSFKQKESGALESLDDDNKNILEDVPSTSEVSVMGNLSGNNKMDLVVHSADSSCINLDASAKLSLEEKVANFIQNGDLDLVEDHVPGISDGDDSQESEVHIESECVVDMPLNAHLPEDNNVVAFNGKSLTAKDNHTPQKDLSTHLDENFNAEAPKVENQSEINHLKFMLYQKELELSRLKEQIEKEKLALSVLQTKAELEISKARKLISEKDVELHVAEESLSGLKEVQIEFRGDGNVVEVAGSFNGWHHRIKMDPQPSTSALDLGGSRRPRSWSTILWLYPGVYEIKFVVDDHWIIDPKRESVQRGHICNNILRVAR